MNLDERENYRQDDAYFQDDETRYENDHQYDDIDIDTPSADHSISDNAQPDYGNDFAAEEINRQSLNPDGDKFDEEFDREEDNELEDDDDLDDDDAELDEEDETGTNPNRNL